MSVKIRKMLENKGGNYILPFFWQHGEDELKLREYMQIIDESNIKAVCVESRPHPDFCGPKWWKDMDVILDEARKRDMKVWILDDSHFPTGFANGAMSNQPDERCRQGLCCRVYGCGEKLFEIEADELFHPDPWEPNQIEMYIGEKNARKFNDDRLIGLYAVRSDGEKDGFTDKAMRIDLQQYIEEDKLVWEVPEGKWNVYALHLSRNTGYHRSYINMMDKASCKVLLDAVYEPHYARYKEEFGKTIAGFFSDEPELGNGHIYEWGKVFGTHNDLPWSQELEERLRKQLGEDFAVQLALLWEQEADPDQKAKIRYAYMDAVTRLVEEDFSRQIGSWCRDRGVQYIGHLIEDNDEHTRLGSSLGHYYRGLAGQDMAGIDNIGGQVLPQQEDVDLNSGPFATRSGEFYHYVLGKLGSSAAAIEPRKKGNSLCEIFGNYGWECGVRLEKYLVDHFLVRGINHYVPHAFSPAEFPDSDCPPHFYAHGHNPQYRHFGALMAYTNRVCELISGGRHIAPVAVIYHAEGEWTGRYMFSRKIGHVMADHQIEYDYIPQDVFAQSEDFRTEITPSTLRVNTQEYKIVIVPDMQYITRAFAEAVAKMSEAGIPVIFAGGVPEGICDAEADKELIEQVASCGVCQVDELVPLVQNLQFTDIKIKPEYDRLRYMHYEHEDGSAVYMFVNEGIETYRGRVQLAEERCGYLYDAWENQVYPAEYSGGELTVEVVPLKSLIVIFDKEYPKSFGEPVSNAGEVLAFAKEWQRSLCKSVEYPAFKDEKQVMLPDDLAAEKPEFSGFARYENTFHISGMNCVTLRIEDAHEGVEVFVNGEGQGIQIAPPFVYDITAAVKDGDNFVAIEVATTLEREMAMIPDRRTGQKKEVHARSGITGEVLLTIHKHSHESSERTVAYENTLRKEREFEYGGTRSRE